MIYLKALFVQYSLHGRQFFAFIVVIFGGTQGLEFSSLVADEPKTLKSHIPPYLVKRLAPKPKITKITAKMRF